ncbi:hypothetical protein PG997_014440 [Apiospora hydei]|uniref:Uncharacterized protein n=1 Tax=Apiospora hydei TaxID=1337664 RepID=A0ABR1UX10_9PEZI
MPYALCSTNMRIEVPSSSSPPAASKPEPTDLQVLGALFDLKDKKNVNQRFNRLSAKMGWFKTADDGPSTFGQDWRKQQGWKGDWPEAGKFGKWGAVFVKIRRDKKNMPCAFCQYTVSRFCRVVFLI